MISYKRAILAEASTEGKTHLADRETELEGNVTPGSISHLIFGADFFPFTNTDIYGSLMTINGTKPFHSLSENIHFPSFKTNMGIS